MQQQYQILSYTAVNISKLREMKLLTGWIPEKSIKKQKKVMYVQVN
jgi:hypothetical protein